MNEHAHHLSTADKWKLGAIATAGGIIAAPYIFPSSNLALSAGSIMARFHATGLGSGIAGAINTGISHIPLIGQTLITNSVASFCLTGAIGLGGMFLANYLEKKEKNMPEGHIKWSKIVRYASLATSILIALPAILTGLGVGLTFLAATVGGIAFGSKVFGFLATKVGSVVATVGGGESLAAAALPHLLTCGSALLPLGLGPLFGHRGHEEASANPAGLEMKLISSAVPQPWAPCELAFQLIDTKSGKPLTPDALATVHTKKLHTMIVDRSLTDYHHLHPVYDEQSGLFRCSFVPQLNQPYSAWHDATRADSGERAALKNDLPAMRGMKLSPLVVPVRSAMVDGIRMDIRSVAPVRAGEAGTLAIELRDASGAQLRGLEPIMGAYAHLVGFSADGKNLIHCHPLGEEPRNSADRGTGMLHFHMTPPAGGSFKFFLQIKRNGEETVIPFGQMIAPPSQFAARSGAASVSHPHAGMAMG